MSYPKRKFHNLGTMMVAKKKDPTDGDEPKRFYIKLEQQKGKDGKIYGDQIFPITLANGAVLNDGDILPLFSKKDKLQDLVKAGKMTQDLADTLSAFLLFEVCATEVVEDGATSAKSSVPF